MFQKQRFSKKITLFFLFFFFLPLNSVKSELLPTQSQSQIVPRKILAFYDPKEEKNLFFTIIHQYAEMPLNHLGLEVIYRAADQPLLSDEDMRDVRGILTWFSKNRIFPDPDVYCDWLKKQMEAGKKVVILGDLGFFKPKYDDLTPSCQAAFHTLGANIQTNYIDNPFFLEIVYKDSPMIEFERKLSLAEHPSYDLVKVLDANSKIYLQIKRTDISDSTSSLAFTTSKGGYVHSSYTHYLDEFLEKVQWRLNPFRFFEAAFATQDLPKPDTTTINGRRIFYTHIDGDGIFNVSAVDGKSYSGEILYNEILKKYSHIPFTVSIITGYLDLPKFNTDREKKLYRNLFSLPNVEPASHGYAHPLQWTNQHRVSLDIPHYKFDATKEIQGSIALIKNLLKADNINKKVNLFLWTGDCLPDHDGIKTATDAQILNLNGGDSQFNRHFNSYMFLAPLGINRNGAQQIYSSAANENLYTNSFKGPFYGYGEIFETYENAETPIRVKPINAYYHFYSAEKPVLLTILKRIYEYAQAKNVFPIFTSEFAALANDFFATKISTLPGGYHIEHPGNLSTIRFDNQNQNLDLDKSKNVLGFQHYQNNLYVFLDDAKSHDIYLTAQKPNRPYLINANFRIKNFQANKNQVSFAKQGWLKGEGVFGGLMPLAKYRVQCGEEDLALQTNSEGTLAVLFKDSEGSNSFRNISLKLQSQSK